MRVLFEYGKSKCELSITSNDVVIIPDLFADDEKLYNKLLKEVFDTKFDKQELIKQWHEGFHLIVNDHLDCTKNDILLNDFSNYQSSLAWSSSVPSNFELPLFVNNNASLLIGGKSSFLTSEIEVYSLVKKVTSIQVIQNADECHALVPCFIQPIIKIIDSNVYIN